MQKDSDITITQPLNKVNQYPTKESFINIIESKDMNEFLSVIIEHNPYINAELICLLSELLKSCDGNVTRYCTIYKESIGIFLWMKYSMKRLEITFLQYNLLLQHK